MSNDNTEKKAYVNHSLSSFNAIFKGFKEIKKDVFVADLALMSGRNDDDKQNFLNGSFICNSSLKSTAKAFLNADFGERDGISVAVRILNFHAEINISAEGEDHYLNYRGTLTGLALGQFDN